MKTLNSVINEKLVINKNSKIKKHKTLEEFLNSCGFTYDYAGSNDHSKFYKPNSDKNFIKYYNKMHKIEADIFARPQVYEEDINLDINKYCLKCSKDTYNDEIRLKFCESNLRNMLTPPSISSILMYNDPDDKELLYRHKKNLSDEEKQYLEEKFVNLLENIFNS